MFELYHTKPALKLAAQWKFGQNLEGVHHEYGNRYFVITIHGQKTYIEDGDFIVQEPDGKHHYPCKPEIWLASHEKVDTQTKV